MLAQAPSPGEGCSMMQIRTPPPGPPQTLPQIVNLSSESGSEGGGGGGGRSPAPAGAGPWPEDRASLPRGGRRRGAWAARPPCLPGERRQRSTGKRPPRLGEGRRGRRWSLRHTAGGRGGAAGLPRTEAPLPPRNELNREQGPPAVRAVLAPAAASQLPWCQVTGRASRTGREMKGRETLLLEAQQRRPVP